LFELDGSPGPAWSLDWSPDGTMLASAGFGQVNVWNAQTRIKLAVLKGHSNDVWGVAWSPDGKRIASCGLDGTVRVWSARMLGPAASFDAGKWTLCVAWSPDGGRLASGNIDGDVEIRDAATGEISRRLTGAKGYSVISVAWSPDGRTLAAGQWNGVIYLWNVETGRLLYSLTSPTTERHDANGLAWSPDGHRLASAHQDGKIRLWTPGKSVPEPFEGHAGAARGLAWSPDGRLLVSTGTDSAVRLWEVETGRQISRIEGVPLWILSAAWSPNGKQIAVCNGRYGEQVGGTVFVWAAPDVRRMEPPAWHNTNVRRHPHPAYRPPSPVRREREG
jgi:WD40 repeat protein